MSFQAKSHMVMLAIVAVVCGGYLINVLGWVAETPVAEIVWQPLMLATVVPVVVLSIAAHIAIAALSPRDANAADERDRLIDLRGNSLAGLVLGFGAFIGLALTVFEADSFWIGQALLGALVVSEISGSVTKLVLYRRGV